MTSYTPEQFNRLPKWAQALVSRAERDIEWARMVQEDVAKNAADASLLALDTLGTENESWRGDVVAYRDIYHTRVPVARERDEIAFLVRRGSDREYVTVEARTDGQVEIRGSAPLLLEMHSSNRFTVKVRD